MAKVVRYKDIDTALRIYYQRPELSNSDLTELFPGVGESTIARWKKKIHAMEIEEDVRLSQARVINTKIAYKFFGIDIEDLEKRRAKLIRLGLIPKLEVG